MHCLQRKNSQSRHATRLYAEQEIFSEIFRKWKLSDTFETVLRMRKDCVMQLIRVFAGHIFQNCFNFKKGSWETSLRACMFAWKRVKRLERLPLSCVSFWHICQNVANTFSKTFGNTLLLQPSHIHTINDTFRVPSHKLFIAQEKTLPWSKQTRKYKWYPFNFAFYNKEMFAYLFKKVGLN